MSCVTSQVPWDCSAESSLQLGCQARPSAPASLERSCLEMLPSRGVPDQGLSSNATANCSCPPTGCPTAHPSPLQLSLSHSEWGLSFADPLLPHPELPCGVCLPLCLASGPSESAQFFPESGIAVLPSLSLPIPVSVNPSVLSLPRLLHPALPGKTQSFP